MYWLAFRFRTTRPFIKFENLLLLTLVPSFALGIFHLFNLLLDRSSSVYSDSFRLRKPRSVNNYDAAPKSLGRWRRKTRLLIPTRKLASLLMVAPDSLFSSFSLGFHAFKAPFINSLAQLQARLFRVASVINRKERYLDAWQAYKPSMKDESRAIFAASRKPRLFAVRQVYPAWPIFSIGSRFKNFCSRDSIS